MPDVQRMEVKCHVTNCQYHENNYCYASKIEVNPLKGAEASSTHEALCSTFKPE